MQKHHWSKKETYLSLFKEKDRNIIGKQDSEFQKDVLIGHAKRQGVIIGQTEKQNYHW